MLKRLSSIPKPKCSFTTSQRRHISFALSDEQQSIQDLARKFARTSVLPRAAELDRTMEYPWELIKEAWELGLCGGHVAEKYGGSGLDLLTTSLISEEIAFGCTGVSTALEACGLAQAPLIVAASDELKTKYLGRMCEEPIVAAYGVTEPGAGSDVAAIKTRAQKVGEEYVLNGSKMWITNAGHANWFFVLAVTDPTVSPTKGMSGFVVEAEWDGVEVGKKEINMGQRCSDTRMVSFNDVRVPKENMLAGEGDGFKIAMGAFDITRPLVASSAVGLSQRALEEATLYAQERKTMGKAIIEHGPVGEMLADMSVNTECARALVWKAASIKDEGGKNTFYASMAKLKASNAAVQNANNAVQIFGGAGFNSEYPVEKLYRDAKIFELYEGTSQIQRMIISRNLKNIYPAS